jgi:hypothetical protein
MVSDLTIHASLALYRNALPCVDHFSGTSFIDHRSSLYLCCSAGEWTSTLSLDAHVITTFIPPLTHHSQYLPRRLIRMGWPSGMNWALHFKSSALKILIYHAEESSSKSLRSPLGKSLLHSSMSSASCMGRCISDKMSYSLDPSSTTLHSITGFVFPLTTCTMKIQHLQSYGSFDMRCLRP